MIAMTGWMSEFSKKTLPQRVWKFFRRQGRILRGRPVSALLTLTGIRFCSINIAESFARFADPIVDSEIPKQVLALLSLSSVFGDTTLRVLVPINDKTAPDGTVLSFIRRRADSNR